MAILSVAFLYVFINYTKKGYEIYVVGESLETARYAGMNIKANKIVHAGFRSLCGLAGMIQISRWKELSHTAFPQDMVVLRS